MNVESARSIESQPSESPRERSGAKGTGFPELMESVLGHPSERAKATRSEADEPTDAGSRTRAQRADSGAVRKRGARDVEPEVVAEANGETGPAPRATPTTELERDERDDVRDAAAGEPAEVAPPMDAPAWQIAAVIAVPELVAMASGTPVDPDAPSAGEASSDALAESESTAPAVEVGARAPLPDAMNVLADVAIGRAPIVDAGARQAAVAVVEAATSKGTDETASVADVATAQVEREAGESLEQVVRVVGEVALGRAESRELRTGVASRDGRPGEIEAPMARANDVLPSTTGSSVDLGSGGSARDGQAQAETRMNAPVERVSGEATAAGGAAAPVATNGIVDSSIRGAESFAQIGADGSAPSAPAAPAAPAADVASPTPTGRAQPGPAADAIAIQTDWLATRGGGSARLVLNPPELGEIVIRVSVRQQSVEVVMVAHTALGHSLAQDQSDRLAQAFAHRDLRLDQFEVRRADPSDSSSTGQFGSSDAGARERDRAEDQSGVQEGAAGRGGRRRPGVASAVSPPRFVSTERASGIDLRI